MFSFWNIIYVICIILFVIGLLLFMYTSKAFPYLKYGGLVVAVLSIVTIYITGMFNSVAK